MIFKLLYPVGWSSWVKVQKVIKKEISLKKKIWGREQAAQARGLARYQRAVIFSAMRRNSGIDRRALIEMRFI